MHALFNEFGSNGPSANLSMRQIADRLGVHHTLLTYHFGSRPALLAAVLSEARNRDNRSFIAAGDRDFTSLCRAIWDFYSNESARLRTQTFFHLAGLAVYDRDAYSEFVADLDTLTQLLAAAASRDGMAPGAARDQSLFAVAGIRGLLLQELLTPEINIDGAAERLFESLEHG
ncbi:transcriptional regulator, TetR family [Brevibacterium sp. 239c]|uniref:TetR family transcriptional regulator n=1 Tax=Brevibacterium sp. 239c TaxID=1965356 RepID=UPI000C69EA0D|nr:TetR family transcriptional regulator [Brevibacterium sp. 239c]SMY05063.1 transcriptional regulator, TetR family [Brevibacterium sp. 239c]